MMAREIMTTQPVVIAAEEPISRAAELMALTNVGALPVVNSYSQGRLVGIITDRGIIVRHMAKGGSWDCRVKDHMTGSGVEVVHPGTDARDVFGRMARKRIRRLPVVNDQHTVVGIITQTDVLRRVGSREPLQVEQALEQIATPA